MDQAPMKWKCRQLLLIRDYSGFEPGQRSHPGPVQYQAVADQVIIIGRFYQFEEFAFRFQVGTSHHGADDICNRESLLRDHEASRNHNREKMEAQRRNTVRLKRTCNPWKRLIMCSRLPQRTFNCYVDTSLALSRSETYGEALGYQLTMYY